MTRASSSSFIPHPSSFSSPPTTAAESDVLMIPRGCKHPAEAFEFIAFVQRQDVMEKLCRLHCKNSPLARASDDWVYAHPNPYIDVFDRLAASPNAHIDPISPITPNVNSEIDVAANQSYLLTATPKQALAEAQQRVDKLVEQYRRQEALRGKGKE